jgi:hypothetical protein
MKNMTKHRGCLQGKCTIITLTRPVDVCQGEIDASVHAMHGGEV